MFCDSSPQLSQNGPLTRGRLEGPSVLDPTAPSTLFLPSSNSPLGDGFIGKWRSSNRGGNNAPAGGSGLRGVQSEHDERRPDAQVAEGPDEVIRQPTVGALTGAHHQPSSLSLVATLIMKLS